MDDEHVPWQGPYAFDFKWAQIACHHARSINRHSKLTPKRGGFFESWAEESAAAPNVQGGDPRLDLRAEVDRHPEAGEGSATPDVPVPDVVAGYIDPDPLESALRRSLDALVRLLQAVRANIVDIAAAI